MVIQAINSGADFYLQKGGEPVAQFAELSHKIRQAVQKRQAETSIRDHERREADIISFLPDATFAIDTNGVVIAWNRAIEEMTGVKAEEMLGKGNYEYALPLYHERRPTVIDLILQDDPAIAAAYPSLERDGQTLTGEATGTDLVNSKGATIWFTAAPLYNNQGVVVGAIESIRDITERKQAETAIRESENLYRTIFETTGAATIIIGNDTTIIRANSEFARMSGYSLEELEGKKSWTEFVAPEDRELMKGYHTIRRADPLNETKVYEFRFISRSGEIRHCIVHVSLIPGTMQSVASVVDITDRKLAELEREKNHNELVASFEQLTAAEEELKGQFNALAESECFTRQSEERLIMAQEIGQTGSWEYNDQTKKIWASAEGHRIFGFPPVEGDFPIEDIESCIPEKERVRKALVNLITEEKEYNLEYTINPTDGSAPRMIHSIARLEKGNPGNAARVVGVIQDITVRKVQELALLKNNEELSASYEEITATEDKLRANLEEMTRAEQALRESETRLSLAMEVGNAGIWEWNLDTSEVRFNAPFHAMLDYEPGELPATLEEWLTYHHPDDLPAMLAKAQAFMRGESPVYESEHRIRAKDGEWNWIFTRGKTASHPAPGSSREFLGFAMNVTGRKKAENALRESEEKYRSVIENIQDVYYRSDREGNLLMVSPSVYTLLGYQAPEEVIGKTITDAFYFDPGEREQFLAALDETGSVRDFEIRLRRKDGTPVIVATSSHYYCDASGTIAGIEGIFRDITIQKKLNDALKDSAKRLAEIISFLPDATFAIDKDGIVIAWNRAIEELTGIPAGQIIGKGDYEYAIPIYGTRCPILIDLVFSPKEKIPEKYSYIDLNGDVLTAETTNASLLGKPVILWGKAAPLYDREGTITGAIESIRDVTERKRTEEALGLANRKLTLLTRITRHDINNQLAALLGYLALLEKRQSCTTDNEFLLKGILSAQRISAMIQFTREYECIGVKAPAWQDCRSLADTAAKQVPPGVIRVNNDIPAGTEVFADPLIVKVFYNLIDNAMRSGGKITTIRFSVEEQNGVNVVVCEDDGEGVPAEEKMKIFERGFGKNTGLGLTLAREILDITGITIRETGEPGKGARFEMTVPDGELRRK